MAVRIQTRESTATEWTNSDPVLAAGEFGFEKDTSRIKVGNGGTPWTSLKYLGQISPRLVASFTFAQATFDTSALAVANASSEITVSDRAGKPAYSDGTDWRFYADNLVIS